MISKYKNLLLELEEKMGPHAEKIGLVLLGIVSGFGLFYSLILMAHISLVGLKEKDQDVAEIILPLALGSGLLGLSVLWYFPSFFIAMNGLMALPLVYVIAIVALDVYDQNELKAKWTYPIKLLPASVTYRKSIKKGEGLIAGEIAGVNVTKD